MQSLQSFIQTDFVRTMARITSGLAGLAMLIILAILILHTIYITSKKSMLLYSKKQPVPGWSKRFYPACLLLILVLLTLMWVLNTWAHGKY